MLQVTVQRTVHYPEYQVFSQTVILNNAKKLTPGTAREAIAIAFGGGTGTVIGNGYGYRVYPNSHRKFYPDLY